jgi:hypothetical protein
MDFQPKQTVVVIDSECPQLHRQKVVLLKRNPRNTAEWEVSLYGKVWIVHTCRLRSVDYATTAN